MQVSGVFSKRASDSKFQTRRCACVLQGHGRTARDRALVYTSIRYRDSRYCAGGTHELSTNVWSSPSTMDLSIALVFFFCIALPPWKGRCGARDKRLWQPDLSDGGRWNLRSQPEGDSAKSQGIHAGRAAAFWRSSLCSPRRGAARRDATDSSQEFRRTGTLGGGSGMRGQLAFTVPSPSGVSGSVHSRARDHTDQRRKKGRSTFSQSL